MNNIKTHLALGRNWTISRDLGLSPFGLFSIVRHRNLQTLDGALASAYRRQMELHHELRHHENQFTEATDRKTRLAHDLLREETIWKTSLESANKKKDLASSLYSLEHINISLKIQDTKRHIEALRPDIEESDHEATHHATFHPLESQISKFMEMKTQLIAANQEHDALKEKPQAISNLVARFKKARNDHMQISSRLQKTRADYAYSQKQVQHIDKLIASIHRASETEIMFPRILTPRFWIDSFHSIRIGNKHK